MTLEDLRARHNMSDDVLRDVAQYGDACVKMRLKSLIAQLEDEKKKYESYWSTRRLSC